MTDEIVSRIDICPKCGNHMTQTVMDHLIIRTCLVDGYEAKDTQ